MCQPVWKSRVSLLCISVLVCVFSLLVVPIDAQQSVQSTQSEPQALQILAQALAAMGGSSAASQIQDSVVQGTETSLLPGSTTGNVIIKTNGPDQIRWDSSSSAGSSSVIVNRGRTMKNRDSRGWKVGPSENAMHQRPTHLPALLLAYELARPDCLVTYVGSEVFQSRQVQHLELARVFHSGKSKLDAKLTSDSKIEVYVDAQTLTVSKVSYVLLSDTDWRRGVPLEIEYGNYKVLNGIMVPLTQKIFFNGRPDSELDITSASFNTAVPETDFEAN